MHPGAAQARRTTLISIEDRQIAGVRQTPRRDVCPSPNPMAPVQLQCDTSAAAGMFIRRTAAPTLSIDHQSLRVSNGTQSARPERGWPAESHRICNLDNCARRTTARTKLSSYRSPGKHPRNHTSRTDNRPLWVWAPAMMNTCLRTLFPSGLERRHRTSNLEKFTASGAPAR